MNVLCKIILLLGLLNPVTLLAQGSFGSTAELTVCFDVQHSYISDLGFYLIGPQECGSPIVPLSPNPHSVNSSNGCCCNSENDTDSLCFSTIGTEYLNICEYVGDSITGVYIGYDSVSGPTLIDWSPLFGCPIESGSWRAQIFDCIGGDVGQVINASISVNGITDSYSFPLVAVSSDINDNSCDFQTASTIQFGVDVITSTAISEGAQYVKFEYNTTQNTIGFSSTQHDVLNVELYDLSGRVLLKQGLPVNEQLPLPRIGSIGILSVRDKAGQQIQTIKLVLPN